MRVLHLCWSYLSEWFPGEGSFFRNMVEPLRDAALDVTVVTPVPYAPRFLGRLIPPGVRRVAVLPRSYEFNAVPVLVPRYARLPRRLDGDLLPVLMARAVASAVHDKPHILHAHFAYPYGVAALHLSRRWRVPVVLTIHGDDGTILPYRSEGDRRRFVRAVRGADHVLAVSDDLVRRTYDLAGRTVEFWPIGVDLNVFRRRTEDRAVLRRRLGLPTDKKLLLFVSALTEQKGVDQVPALMDRLHPGIRAVLVGDGPLRQEICNNPRCIWVPPIPNSRVAEYLSAADVMVLPTEREGTPTVLVEAGAAHLPIVANAVSGIPDLLADCRGVLAEPHNMDSLVRAIEETLSDPEASGQRAARLYAFVATHYDCSSNGQRLKQLYERLLAQRCADPLSDPGIAGKI